MINRRYFFIKKKSIIHQKKKKIEGGNRIKRKQIIQPFFIYKIAFTYRIWKICKFHRPASFLLLFLLQIMIYFCFQFGTFYGVHNFVKKNIGPEIGYPSNLSHAVFDYLKLNCKKSFGLSKIN